MRNEIKYKPENSDNDNIHNFNYIKIDNQKNVEITIKEHIGSPAYPDVIGYTIPKIYPSCSIEFPYNSAKNIRSIIIKNTEGEVFESLN